MKKARRVKSQPNFHKALRVINNIRSNGCMFPLYLSFFSNSHLAAKASHHHSVTAPSSPPVSPLPAIPIPTAQFSSQSSQSSSHFAPSLPKQPQSARDYASVRQTMRSTLFPLIAISRKQSGEVNQHRLVRAKSEDDLRKDILHRSSSSHTSHKEVCLSTKTPRQAH